MLSSGWMAIFSLIFDVVIWLIFVLSSGWMIRFSLALGHYHLAG
jgi:hypothetical protein